MSEYFLVDTEQSTDNAETKRDWKHVGKAWHASEHKAWEQAD